MPSHWECCLIAGVPSFDLMSLVHSSFNRSLVIFHHQHRRGHVLGSKFAIILDSTSICHLREWLRFAEWCHIDSRLNVIRYYLHSLGSDVLLHPYKYFMSSFGFFPFAPSFHRSSWSIASC